MAQSTAAVKCCPKTPQALGLPDQFQKWRTNQAEGIELANSDNKRVTVICAPTGFGKELLCVGTARLSEVPTCIVTDSRGLQDQYLSTYKNLGIADIRGKRNYPCHYKGEDGYTCEDGAAANCPFKGSVQCPYSKAEMKCASSNLVLTNYDKWTVTKRTGCLAHIEQVIFDEAHCLPEALARALQVLLHNREVHEILNLEFPQGSDADDMREWKLWAIIAKEIAEKKLKEQGNTIAKTHNPTLNSLKRLNHLRNLIKRLAVISTAPAKDWVVDQTIDGYQFDPIRPGKYSEGALFLRTPKVVCVSATVRPKTMYMAGVSNEHFTFIEFPSEFNPARCPVYYIPTMNVRGLDQDLSPIWTRLEQWARRRRGVNGIVHTISYKRQEDLVNTSSLADHMLINRRGDPPTEMVEYFKSIPDTGTIFVSPSIHTGYDFPNNQCRWQFVVKVPFEPPSKILKARQEDDKEYTYYKAMQYLVQSFGRDMRNKDDWSERIIADENMEWFMRRYGYLAPKSFHSVYKEINVLPPPLTL